MHPGTSLALLMVPTIAMTLTATEALYAPNRLALASSLPQNFPHAYSFLIMVRSAAPSSLNFVRDVVSDFGPTTESSQVCARTRTRTRTAAYNFSSPFI